MIKLQTTFRCVCSATNRESLLEATTWKTALAEAQLLLCRNGAFAGYVVREFELTEYDDQGRLTDVDLLSVERRKVSWN